MRFTIRKLYAIYMVYAYIVKFTSVSKLSFYIASGRLLDGP